MSELPVEDLLRRDKCVTVFSIGSNGGCFSFLRGGIFMPFLQEVI